MNALWRETLDSLRRQPALLLALRGRDAVGLAALSDRDQDAGVDAASAYERTSGGLPPPPESQAPAAASRPDAWLELDILRHQRLLDQAADAAGRALDILHGIAGPTWRGWRPRSRARGT